jgi:hypothetical protein
MNEVITPEDIVYLNRVAKYIRAMDANVVNINIDASDWDDNHGDIKHIDWEYVTHFDEYYQRKDIPSGFITILQKIFKYLDESGKYEYPDIDELNYNRFDIEFAALNKSLTIFQEYGYNDEGGEGELEFEEPELIEEWKDQLETNGITIPENGILSISYSGGGDDGSLDGNFEENGRDYPAGMEDFCYNELSSNYGGWENNEGGQGRFEFNFNDGTIFLYHTQNIEEHDRKTLFEVDF